MNADAIRRAVGQLCDARAFAGPFGDKQQRALLRDVEAVVQRLLPRGTRAAVRVDGAGEGLPEGIGGVVEVTLIGGPNRVRTLRFELSSL